MNVIPPGITPLSVLLLLLLLGERGLSPRCNQSRGTGDLEKFGRSASSWFTRLYLTPSDQWKAVDLMPDGISSKLFH